MAKRMFSGSDNMTELMRTLSDLHEDELEIWDATCNRSKYDVYLSLYACLQRNSNTHANIHFSLKAVIRNLVENTFAVSGEWLMTWPAFVDWLVFFLN